MEIRFVHVARLGLFVLLLACGTRSTDPDKQDLPTYTRWRASMDSARAVELSDQRATLRHLRVALAIADSNGMTGRVLETKESIAYQQAFLQDTAAIAEMDTLVGVRRANGDSLLLLRALRIQGEILCRILRFRRSEEVLLEAVAIGSHIDAKEELSRVNGVLGDVRFRRGNSQGGLDAYRAGVEQARASGGKDALVMAWALLAQGELLVGATGSAMAHFDSCIRVSKELGLREREAVAHANLAYLRTIQGDHPRAADSYQRAADMQAMMGNKGATAIALYGLACVLENLQEKEEAYHTFRRAIAVQEEDGNRMMAAAFGGGYGGLLAEMDTTLLAAVGHDHPDVTSEAFALMERASEVVREMHQLPMVAELEIKIGSLLLRNGRAEEARAHLREGTGIAERIDDRFGEARAHWKLGSMEDTLGHRAAAMSHYTRAIELADSTGNKEVLASALEARHALHRRNGNLRQALEDRARSAQVSGELYNAANVAHVTRTRLQSAFAKEQAQDSLVFAERMGEQERAAQRTLDAQRARMMNIIAIVALLVLVGVGAFWLDRRRRRERFAKQAAILETKALRAQMNPHFLFNALNSISAYIRTQQPDRAHVFIARFAKLMRSVLENSRRTEVSLQEDLEALRLYMDLEQARSDNKFDHVITLGPDVDPASTLVPPMVMQPFVENAIWHGVGRLVGRGAVTLHVDISKDRSQLLMTVTDDGVGRAARAEAAQRDEPSLGTRITGERLALLAQQTGAWAGFRYVEVGKGTCVEVSLPLRVA